MKTEELEKKIFEIITKEPFTPNSLLIFLSYLQVLNKEIKDIKDRQLQMLEWIKEMNNELIDKKK